MVTPLGIGSPCLRTSYASAPSPVNALAQLVGVDVAITKPNSHDILFCCSCLLGKTLIFCIPASESHATRMSNLHMYTNKSFDHEVSTKSLYMTRRSTHAYDKSSSNRGTLMGGTGWGALS